MPSYDGLAGSQAACVKAKTKIGTKRDDVKFPIWLNGSGEIIGERR